MADGIIILTSANFDETVKSSTTPILVDFWAEWCGPCKQIAPILEQIATDMPSQITIAKLNVDDYGDIAGRFNVMSIPTMLLFHKGEIKTKIVGAMPKGRMLEELSKFLPASQ
jgi:thioredoxin 1